MKKLIIPYIEGYSSSSRKDEVTLSDTIKKIIKQYENDFTIVSKEFTSFGFWKSRQVRRWITKNSNAGDNLLLVGKSMGGVKVHDITTRFFNDWKDLDKIGITIIDGHSSTIQDFFKSPHGKYRGFAWSYLWDGRMGDSLEINNVYQHNKYPEGASFPTATINLDLTGQNVDHFNITHYNEVIELLKSSFDYFV